MLVLQGEGDESSELAGLVLTEQLLAYGAVLHKAEACRRQLFVETEISVETTHYSIDLPPSEWRYIPIFKWDVMFSPFRLSPSIEATTHLERVMSTGRISVSVVEPCSFDLDFPVSSSCIATDGCRLYVAGFCNDKAITIYERDGTITSSLPWTAPSGLAVVDKELYIADSMNHSIVITTLDGKYQRTMRLREEDNPMAIVVDRDEIFAADSNHCRVSVWDYRSHQFLRQFNAGARLDYLSDWLHCVPLESMACTTIIFL